MPHFPVQRINTILYCRRWKATLRFYEEVLGLAVHHATGWLVEFELTPNAYLSIADAERTTIPSAEGAGITLSIRVDDIDAVCQRLQAAGVRTSPMQSRWGARSFFIWDPEGHRIELWNGTKV